MWNPTDAPFIVGDVVFLHCPATTMGPSKVIAAEIIRYNLEHSTLFDLWADGRTYGPVNVTHRGQSNLRARAPQWALDAVDNGPWGNF